MKRLAVAIAVMIVALYTPASASSDATKVNNGAKLMLKEGTDSLFCTYDNDGTVKYSYSVGGAFWSYPVDVGVGVHDYPAIAADSTGQRWLLAHKPPVGNGHGSQSLYYFSGGQWRAVTTLYESRDVIGPASLAGGTSLVTNFIYAAFRVADTTTDSTNDPDEYRIVLVKYNGSTISACTLNTAYAPSESLGDPAVAVEPYTADSNRVYVVWEREGIIYYCMDVDGRGSGISDNWTSNVGLSDSNYVCRHPCIKADRDRVVVAWAQGSPPDIYAREGLVPDWGESAVNLSNSAGDSSDYPTIALDDTVVVAWEEALSVNDHDIYACIDFDDEDVRSIADNATVSSYPHIVLQDDGEHLYLHTFWSEPSYAVDHDRLDLRDDGGEGHQSAASVPITVQPSLAACEPNPVRGHTRISYALPAAGNVSLGVYDATGRPVRMLASGSQPAGNYSVGWDARDADGKQVPYGVYFYRLDTPGFRSVKKAVVTR